MVAVFAKDKKDVAIVYSEVLAQGQLFIPLINLRQLLQVTMENPSDGKLQAIVINSGSQCLYGARFRGCQKYGGNSRGSRYEAKNVAVPSTGVIGVPYLWIL